MWLTRRVGTMWCAYVFCGLALVSLPAAIRSGDPVILVSWVSQTFLQLVLLAVIMVGQDILGRTNDARAELTYKDAEAVLHEAAEIQRHLEVQDDHLGAQDAQLADLAAALGAALARVNALAPPAGG